MIRFCSFRWASRVLANWKLQYKIRIDENVAGCWFSGCFGNQGVRFDLNHLNAINCAVFILIKNNQFSSSIVVLMIVGRIRAPSATEQVIAHCLETALSQSKRVPSGWIASEQTHHKKSWFLSAPSVTPSNYSTFLVLLMNRLFRNDHKVAALSSQFKKLLKFLKRRSNGIDASCLGCSERLQHQIKVLL